VGLKVAADASLFVPVSFIIDPFSFVMVGTDTKDSLFVSTTYRMSSFSISRALLESFLTGFILGSFSFFISGLTLWFGIIVTGPI
jgi:hypothetical protein